MSVLRHISELTHAIDDDPSLMCFDESEEAESEGTLSASGSSDDTDLLPGRNGE